VASVLRGHADRRAMWAVGLGWGYSAVQAACQSNRNTPTTAAASRGWPTWWA